MRIRRLTAVVGMSALVVAVMAVPTSTAGAATSSPPTIRHIFKVGTAAYHPTATGSGALQSLSTEIADLGGGAGPDFARQAASAPQRSRLVNRSPAPRRNAAIRGQLVASAGLAPAAASVIQSGPQLLRSFDGLNHYDQRTANGGNQFSVEPPDQGLCVGGGHVVEVVNDVFRVFNANGTGQTGVEDLNSFLGYPEAINRTTGARGPDVTDPSCLYDPTTGSFFLTVLTLDGLPDGTLTGRTHLDIAVTQHPTGKWNIYRLDATDDGTNGTPLHANCPCLGDYPHIGVDANGLYVTTNEFSFFGTAYNSAQIYAFSKRALARGASDVLVTQLDTIGQDRGQPGFTVWPAQSPAVNQYASAASGTEYFLSSNAVFTDTGVSNNILTWSLTNSASLNTSSPSVHLHHTRVTVATYSVPPLANQKNGPTPLADCLNFDPCGLSILAAPDPFKPEAEHGLDSNDTRMQQVTYSNGRLYGALDTAVTVGGAQKAGVAWYIIKPASTSTAVTASLVRQGKLGLAGNNLTYPAIGINSAGAGVMTFTLVGSDYYPSAAYSAFSGNAGAGSIFVARAGLGPDDGFTGYSGILAPNPADPRWGDYGATAVDGSNIWIASEYIGQTCTDTQYVAAPFGTCSATRTALANWDTRISLIKP